MNSIKHGFEIFSGVAKVISWIGSFSSVVSKIHDEKKMNTDQKVQFVAEIVFTFFQSVDLAVTGMNYFFHDKLDYISNKIGTSADTLVLGSSIAVGTIDVGKTITIKCIKEELKIEDIIDVIAIVVFRAGDSLRKTAPIFTSEQDKRIINYVSASVSSLGGLYAVGNISFKVYRKDETLFKATQIMLKYFKTDDNPNHISVLEEESCQNAVDLELQYQNDIIAMKDWKTLQRIPSSMHGFFKLYRCKITGLPIRFILKLRAIDNTLGIDKEIHYEASEINKWRSENPRQSPPGWPEEVIYNNELPYEDDIAQAKIDSQIKTTVRTLNNDFIRNT